MHYDRRPLGHTKLETTARYTQVATNIIRQVKSPLDRLSPLLPKGEPQLKSPRTPDEDEPEPVA